MCCLRTATSVIEVMIGMVVDYIVLSLYCHAAIEVMTGLVVEYIVLSMYCHSCH